MKPGIDDPWTDDEERYAPLAPIGLRAWPAKNNNVAITIKEQAANKVRAVTKEFHVYFVPYSLFTGTDLAAPDGWQKLRNLLAGSEVVTRFSALHRAGEQTNWIAKTWGEQGWYVATGVSAMGRESEPTAPYPSPWNPLTDGGLYFGGDDPGSDDLPGDVTDPEVLVQAIAEQNYGQPVCRLRCSADVPNPLGNFSGFQLYVENYHHADDWWEWLTVNRGVVETGEITGYFVLNPDCPPSAWAVTTVTKTAANHFLAVPVTDTFQTRLACAAYLSLWNHDLGDVETLKIASMVAAPGGYDVTTVTDSVKDIGTVWEPEGNEALTHHYCLFWGGRRSVFDTNPQSTPHPVTFYFVAISEKGRRRTDWRNSPKVTLPFGIRPDMIDPTQVVNLTVRPQGATLVLTWELPLDPDYGADDTVGGFQIYRRRVGCQATFGDSQHQPWGEVPDSNWHYAYVEVAKLSDHSGIYRYVDRNFNIDATVNPTLDPYDNPLLHPGGYDFNPANPGIYEYVVTAVSKTGYENRSFHAGNIDPERNHYVRSVLGDTQETDVGPVRDSLHNRLFNTGFHAPPCLDCADILPIIAQIGQAYQPVPCAGRPDNTPNGEAGAVYTFGYWYSAEAYAIPRWSDDGATAVLWKRPIPQIDWLNGGTIDAPLGDDPRCLELLASESTYPKWNPDCHENGYGKLRWDPALGASTLLVQNDDDLYSVWMTGKDDAADGDPWYLTGTVDDDHFTIQDTVAAPASVSINCDNSQNTQAWRSGALPVGTNVLNLSRMFHVHVATGSSDILDQVRYRIDLNIWHTGDTRTNVATMDDIWYWEWGTGIFAYDIPLRGTGSIVTVAGDELEIVFTAWTVNTGKTNQLIVWTGTGYATGWSEPAEAPNCYLVVNNDGTRGVSAGEAQISTHGRGRDLCQVIRRDRFYPGERLVIACDFSLRSDGLQTVEAPDSNPDAYHDDFLDQRPNCGTIRMLLSRFDYNRQTIGGVPHDWGMERDIFHVDYPITSLPTVPAGQKRNWMRFYGEVKIPKPIMTTGGLECRGTGYVQAGGLTVFTVNGGVGPPEDNSDTWINCTLVLTDVGGGGTEERHKILILNKRLVTGGYVWDVGFENAAIRGAGPAGYYVIPMFTHYCFAFGRGISQEGKKTWIKVGSTFYDDESIVIRRPMVNGGFVGAPWTNDLFYELAPGQSFDNGVGGTTPPPTGGGGDPTPGDTSGGGPDEVCVAGDTPILLADGNYREAQLIRPGDRLVSLVNGRTTVTKVTDVHANPVGRVFEVVDAEGRRLVCSEGHRFAVNGHKALGWRKAKDVLPGERFVAVDRGTVHLTEILTVTERPGTATVYTFSCEPHHNYVAGVFVSHNKRNRGTFSV